MEIQSFEQTAFAVNCYVIRDGGEAIIIDPGEASAALKASVADLRVSAIVNTHCHVDHCAGNAAMIEATGAPLACHKADLPLLRGLEQQGMLFGFEVAESPEPDRFLEDGDTISVGTLTLEVLHAPGHSPGHVVLAGDGFVVVGDVLFAGSIGRTDLMGGNHAQLLESIRTKLLPLPDETVVYCGHGPSTTIGAERASNPFLVGL